MAGQAFWGLSLREIQNVLSGHVKRHEREQENRAWAVWHIAFLTAYAPQKSRNFWKLKDLTGANEPTGKRMTPQQIEAVTKSWLASRHRKGKPHGK